MSFTADAQDALLNGFGPSKSGEDPFDAFVGLIGMIEVVDGRRDEGIASAGDGITWELDPRAAGPSAVFLGRHG